ncbi:MAG TPA: RNase H family protein [Blastocatellia bacterium]|nr:RNase H family protein [Blastocatellia bacterium]
MGKYQYEGKLRSCAAQFIRALRKDEIDGAITEDSIREYSIGVSISSNGKDFGKAIVYYSPRSDSFSVKTHELKDKSIATRLADCWHEIQTQQSDSRYEIYVDGSFINGATGYGAVVLNNGKVVDELSGPVAVADVSATRQVAGELVAVKEALKWCLEHSVDEVSIYYDYLGIEKWATRQWKTNQPLTAEYARFMSECPIRIHWNKVDSHTGNRWNDRADVLAKQGAGSIQPTIQPSMGETEFVGGLMEKTDAWIEFLMMRGIEARFDRVYNAQFARVYIIQQDKPVGTFDLYNTRKKRFSPYLHNFRDDELKTRIEAFWKAFVNSEL